MNDPEIYYIDRDEGLAYIILEKKDRLKYGGAYSPIKLSKAKFKAYTKIMKAYNKMQIALDDHWHSITVAREGGNDFL